MYRVLELLKGDLNYISGEQMGKELNMSRNNISKYINKLKKEGYEITASSKKGYILNSSNLAYNKIEIDKALDYSFNTLNPTVYFYNTIDSTNIEIKKLVNNSNLQNENILVIADSMTQGRGRLGKTWNAPEKSGVWVSLLLKPNLPPNKISVITLLAGLSIAKALNNITDNSLDIGIKWPNDIIVNNKKISGILTEMDCEMDRVNYIILGVGININTDCFPEEIKNIATSLFIEKEKQYSRTEFIKQFLIEFDKIYSDFLNEGFSKFQKEYETMCVNIGRDLKVIRHNEAESFHGIGVSIDDQGNLLVKSNKDNEIVKVYSGEVSIRNIL